MNVRVLVIEDEPQIVRVLRVTFNMTHLRHKLEDDRARPQHLRTEPGMGYRFSA